MRISSVLLTAWLMSCAHPAPLPGPRPGPSPGPTQEERARAASLAQQRAQCLQRLPPPEELAPGPVRLTLAPGDHIDLERKACLGGCPAYSVTLFADGSVEFEGRSHVLRPGAQQWSVEPEAAQRLFQEFVDAGYFKLDRVYASSVKDIPGTVTSLTLGNRKAHVLDRTAQGLALGAGAPPELYRLERLIDQVADTARAVGGPCDLVRAGQN